MRTVSFSEPAVRRLAANQFICTYTNTEGDPTAGQSIQHAPNDRPGSCVRGNGKQNVQTLFLTPEGNIFHVATGYLSGSDLAAEMQFAATLFNELRNKEPAKRQQITVNAHRHRLKASGFSDEQINARPGMELLTMMQDLGNANSANSRNQRRANHQGNHFGQMAQQDRPSQVFDQFSRSQFLADNKFSISRPLMSRESFEQNPSLLVGTGRTFFASSSNNSNFNFSPGIGDRNNRRANNSQFDFDNQNARMQQMMNRFRSQFPNNGRNHK